MTDEPTPRMESNERLIGRGFFMAGSEAPDPRDQRQPGRPDRRQGPRRTEEVAEHYAREALLAAAVSWAAILDTSFANDKSQAAEDDAEGRLYLAVRHWQEAVARAQETPR